MRNRAKVTLLVLVMAIALGTCSPAAASPTLPLDAYSWSMEFAQWNFLTSYSTSWRLDSPFQAKQGASDWKAVAVPFNQPGDPADDAYLENPHRGVDFTSAPAGTSVYAVAYGKILSVTVEASGTCSTILQDVDFQNDGVMDGIRVEYRHVVTSRKTPQPGASVTPSTLLGTVGWDRTGIARLHLRLYGDTRYRSGAAVSPVYPFYDNVASWHDGNDTSFTGFCWYYTNEPQTVYLVAYGRNLLTGEIVAPAEVTIYHEKFYPGLPITSWRESPMPQVSSDPPTYAFNFLDYRDEAGDPYYIRDGQKVGHIIRLRFGSTPGLYQWAFSPAAYERPYENPNDWGSHSDVFTYLTMPCDPLSHYWYSQKVAMQGDARYYWECQNLNLLYYWNLANPAWDPDRNVTPFYQETSPTGLMQQYGCNAVCWAMVLKNLGEQGDYLRRDIRYGSDPPPRYLAADPFGVTLASTQDFEQWWSIYDGCYYSNWTMDWAVPPEENDPTTVPVALYYPRVLGEYGVASAKWRHFGLTNLSMAVDELTGSLTVDSSSSFPPAPFYVTVQTGATSQPEVMKVTDVSGNVFTVLRGELGTTPIAHAAGDAIYEGTDELKAMAIYRQLVLQEGSDTQPRQVRPQGVIVRLDGHFIVFTDTSLTQASFPPQDWEDYGDWALSGYFDIYPGPVEPEVASDDLDQVVRLMSSLYPATSYELGFTVCDPLAPGPETGADVQFTNSTSFNLSDPKRLFEVEQIMVVGP